MTLTLHTVRGTLHQMRISATFARRAGLALLPAGLGLLVVGLATPAQATNNTGYGGGSPCVTIHHGDTNGFTLYGAATASLTGDGVLMTTGTASNDDAVTWKYTFGAPIDADTVTEASYTTTKLDTAGADVNDAALTAYRIYVRISGKDSALVYEPYWSLAGNPPRNVETSWNVLTGKLWTSSANVPGLPATSGGPATKTFAQVRADNPDMLVTGIGLGLGTYNKGTKSLTNDVHFKAKKSCVTHDWSTRYTKPSPPCCHHSPSPKPSISTSPVTSASPSKSTSATPSKSTSSSAVVTVPTTTTETPVGGGSLAVTPADYDQGQLTGTLAAGAVLVAFGLGLFVWGRRRNRTE